ncbi:ABC transporter ATP-binding protein [Corynebacterium uropygiale]|uniref:ABC transporter ATP-binding protein n=1 Tax=Corynebacterium uropygiale TaxID=1775911 RepID=A0A9X1QQJ8_9CORY|nr:ABC transporter ATP-binding protein [Corynebacterium uropygiale]MCF4007464.1 ABC transporter ATP-binding protein [Corynebacterium uropygiale]
MHSAHEAPLLAIEDLTVNYHTPRGLVHAVRGVSLEVERGQMTAIVGESGSGKSTTAQAAIGLLPDNAQVSGSVMLAGRDVSELSEREWRAVRGRRVGLIPQDPGNSLNPVRTIGESVAEGLAIHGFGSRGSRAREERVIELLDRVGIDDPARRARQYPHELSGGMRQRVLIAAALALEPDLIIADEPTSALDVTVQKVILDLLDEMREDMGIVLITHDLAVAGDRADHVVVMHRGEVRESGLAATVLSDPRDAYSRRLLADAPSLSRPRTRPAVGTDDPLVSVEGFRKSYGDTEVVHGVDFQVQRGSTHALVGESGSGKTTTGRAIAGLLTPSAGRISVETSDVQLVYQNPAASLDPRWSVGRSIAEPLRSARRRSGGGPRLSRAEIQRRVAEALDLVALDPELAERRPRELSGGQKQRVAIARALIVRPELVLFDEAVSALDVTVQAQILELLEHLQKELGLTYIFISHDLAVVRQIADTVSVLQRGTQVEQGRVEDVFERPATEYTRRLLDAIPGRHYREGALNLGL